MMFHNDSAYALIMENCTKGKGEDDTWKKAFMKALSKDEEEAVHKAAVKDLMGFIKDAVDMGMYYDVMRFTIKCMIYEDESFDFGIGTAAGHCGISESVYVGLNNNVRNRNYGVVDSGRDSLMKDLFKP